LDDTLTANMFRKWAELMGQHTGANEKVMGKYVASIAQLSAPFREKYI
jgi:hypothetical protein